MQRLTSILMLFVLAPGLLMAPSALAKPAQSTPPPQFRAFWVDAFGAGIFNEAEIDQLVAQAKAANMNAIVAQVGRRGDCFCNNAMMPRTQANIAPYPFDPLQSLIDKAHAEGIEVHAWVIATAIWNSLTPPLDPNHVFNTHGPLATGYDNWIMLRSDGANRGGADYYLDPGHPDAADYIVKMYTSLVANYDIDGINFDRIRYPDYNLVISGTVVPSWGYNPVAVSRFQAATGRTDVPAPSDPQWTQWRRDQVTNIVRRVYLESYAIKPHLRISADTITYGYGPQSVGGWSSTRTYAEVLQDWRAWMEEGVLDFNLPMNYKREHYVTEPNNQQRMYHEWNEFIKDNQYDRQAAIGSAAYLNYITGTVTQVRKALEPSVAGNFAHGWVGYSYRVPDASGRPGDESRPELIMALTQPSHFDPITPPVFADPATVPDMPWKTQPTTGHVRGTVERPRGGGALDQVRVDFYSLYQWPASEQEKGRLAVEKQRQLSASEYEKIIASNKIEFIGSRVTDGKGWWGFVDLKPGLYLALVNPQQAISYPVLVLVSAGELVTIKFIAWPRAQNSLGSTGAARDIDLPGSFDPSEKQMWPNGER